VYNSVAALLAGRPIRFPGVLQRIALSSFVNTVQPFWSWLFPLVATAVWWTLSIRLYNISECTLGEEGVERWFSPPNCTAQSTIDYMVFEKKHMYSADYDPEGLLSTLTTSAVTVTAGLP
jgi:predicted acyltransferase